MAYTTAHKTLKQTGYNIHYYTTGNPKNTALVCLHPAFADHNCFNLQINALSDHYYIIAIDMLGHGLSQPEKTNDKIDQTPNHIKQILTIEGLKEVHVLGVSLGSLMAQYFAECYPEMVLSTIILGGYNINISDTEINKAQRNEALKWIVKLVFSMESFRRYVAKQSVINHNSQEGFHEMALKFSRKSLRYMSGLSHVIKNRQPKNPNLPKLILVGEFDLDLARNKAQEFHRNVKSSEFKMIQNAGHCANMDNPEAFNITLLGWLRKN